MFLRWCCAKPMFLSSEVRDKRVSGNGGQEIYTPPLLPPLLCMASQLLRTRTRSQAPCSSSTTAGQFIKMETLQLIALEEGGWRERKEMGGGREEGGLLREACSTMQC